MHTILEIGLGERTTTLEIRKILIMKKTLLALALFGAVAGTASAASVTLYGTVDVGFGMTSVAGDHNARYEAADMNVNAFSFFRVSVWR